MAGFALLLKDGCNILREGWARGRLCERRPLGREEHPQRERQHKRRRKPPCPCHVLTPCPEPQATEAAADYETRALIIWRATHAGRGRIRGWQRVSPAG